MKPVEKKEYLVSTLKGIIGAIPFAGTFINEVAFEARSRVKQNRVNNFIQELSEYMDKETVESLSLDSTDKEAFGDIFEELIVSVMKTSARHKIEIFKKILKNQFLNDPHNTEHVFRFIHITNSINRLQFSILTKFDSLSDKVLKYRAQILELKERLTELEQNLKKQKVLLNDGYNNNTSTLQKLIIENKKSIASKQKTLRENINPNDPRVYDISRNVFLIEIQDLISKGLLFDQTITSQLLKPNENYGLTNLGREYVKYVSEYKKE